ncbi:copper amine oxidase N-terminal domain-containing protein [Paenibacillus sp. YYML68]|uniref:copper amine oxidase N-terminal domain-containing protein n=1 Tax=Paenibacillus sp. YYML68 TaxID=2909250 RepID=UPI002490C336|nr:copper amine oxidase N-terminal domain-containing protein [Paenibacillus sp. YYML68]
MLKKQWKSKLGLTLASISLLAAGCQPVGGVDIAKVMSSSHQINSYVGSSAVSIELIADEAADPKQKELLALLSSMKVNIEEAKMQSKTSASMKGSITYGKANIPFKLVIQDMSYILEIEGADKPIVLRSYAAGMGGNAPQLTEAMQEQLEQLSQRAVEATPTISSFITGHFPNPSVLKVEPANVQINNESLQLNKVHLELNGSELVKLVKQFLLSAIADEQGTKELLAVLYDLYAPLLKETMKSLGGSSPQSQGQNDAFLTILNNKKMAVEFMYMYAKQNIEPFVANLDQTLAMMPIGQSGATYKQWLDDNQSLKLDLYVDAEHQTRMSAMELLLTLPKTAPNGMKALKVTSESKLWDVNKPVTMDTISTENGVIEWMNKSGRLSSSKLVTSLDPQSELYTLLKDQLQITRKQITLPVPPASSSQYFFHGPYNDNGTVMVPVRFVTEQLDAELEWNAAARQVTITEPLSGSVAVLTLDSKEATVNGQPFMLEKAAVLVQGSTYVPIRFIAESMNAKVEWSQEMQSVTINRE